MTLWRWSAVLLPVFWSGYADAFCSYGGKDYARTTIAQEFRDSRYVAEVKVLSGTAAWADESDNRFRARWGSEGNVVSFSFQVLRSYKGAPPTVLRYFSPRNSGGFYFERSWRRVAPAGTPDSFYVGSDLAADVGARYLVFLNPITRHPGMGSAERGATFVNYACGQSKPWREVTGPERALLARLAAHDRRQSKK